MPPTAPVRTPDDVLHVSSTPTAERNWQLVKDSIETAHADGGFTHLVEAYGETLPGLIQRIADYPRTIGVL